MEDDLFELTSVTPREGDGTPLEKEGSHPGSFQELRQSIEAAIGEVGERIEQGTVAATVLNTLCNILGGGILALPNAMRKASVAIAIPLLFVSAVTSSFAVYIIVRAFDVTQRRSLADIFAYILFPEVKETEEVLEKGPLLEKRTHNEAPRPRGELGRAIASNFVDFVVLTGLVGTLVAFARIIMDAMPPVMHQFLHASGIWANEFFWLVVAGIIFFLLTCVRRMTELKWTSFLAFGTIAYVAIVVVIRFFTNMNHPIVHDEESKEIHWFEMSSGIFRGIAVMSFAYCITYNVPLFYRELRDRTPKTMMKTVSISIPIATATYTIVALLGYLTFGEHIGDAKAGGDLTKNYPVDDTLMNIGRLGLFLHFATVFPILSVNVRDCIHRLISKYCCVCDTRSPEELIALGNDVQYTSETAPRYAIVLEAVFIVGISCLMAAVVPGISIVFEVMGCLTSITLVFIIPGLVGTVMWGPSRGLHNRATSLSEGAPVAGPRHTMRVLSICLLIYGCVCCVCGFAALFV